MWTVSGQSQTKWQEQTAWIQILLICIRWVREAKGHFDLSRKALEEYGSKVELFPGVDEWI